LISFGTYSSEAVTSKKLSPLFYFQYHIPHFEFIICHLFDQIVEVVEIVQIIEASRSRLESRSHRKEYLPSTCFEIRILKSQIPSTKLQTNLKFQY